MGRGVCNFKESEMMNENDLDRLIKKLKTEATYYHGQAVISSGEDSLKEDVCDAVSMGLDRIIDKLREIKSVKFKTDNKSV